MKSKMFLALYGALRCTAEQGQAVPATILTIDIENQVQYVGDTFDLSKLATQTRVTPARRLQNSGRNKVPGVSRVSNVTRITMGPPPA
jgi:hypothetical protein